MVMQELKRVTADKDELQKKCSEAEEKAKKLEDEVTALKYATPADSKAEEAPTLNEGLDDKPSDASDKVKSPVASVIGMFSPRQKPQEATDKDDSGDLFSYEDEVPQLQAEIASKTEEIEKLKGEVETLQQELSTAKENSSGLAESLENVTRALGESRDASAIFEARQNALEARNKEIAALNNELNKALEKRSSEIEELKKAGSAQDAKDKETETEATTWKNKCDEKDLELAKAANAALISKRVIHSLNTKVSVLDQEKSEIQGKVNELTKKLAAKPSPPATSPAPAPAPTPAAATPTTSGGKKKNKKKKGKGGAGGASAPPLKSSQPRVPRLHQSLRPLSTLSQPLSWRPRF